MKSRRILSIIGLILAAVLLLGIGFAIGRNEVQAAAPDAADDLSSLAHTSDDVLSLDITVTKVDDNDSQSFSPEEIGNNFNQGMSYCGVSDVYIYLNRTSERLEDALKTAISPRRKSFSVPVRTHGKATVRKLLRQITVCPSIPTIIPPMTSD